MRSLIFDTETTGLLMPTATAASLQPRIIELFAVLVDANGEELARMDRMFDPGLPLPPKIVSITGIRDADLKGKGGFAPEGYDEFEELLERCDEVVGHNVMFDRGMIGAEARRAGIRLVPWPDRMICTVEASEAMFGRRMKLAEMHERVIGEGFSGAHRAEEDVMAVLRIFRVLRERGEV